MVKEIKTPMWDQMQFFCKRIADHQIRLVLHFEKPLDEKILKDAVKITIENNPITCAAYVENKNKVLWKFSENEIDKIFSYKECQQAEELVHETVLEQIDTFTGPQLLVSLIRSKTDTVVLNCNHVVTDAAGVKNFAYQLAHNYTSISQNRPVDKLHNVPSRSLKLLSQKLSIKEKLAIIKLTLSNKKDAPTFHRPLKLEDLQSPDFKTHTITPSEFDEIKAFGKKYSATVNDTLLTVFYFTLRKVLKNSNKTNRLTYASDLRGYLDDANYDVLSNFSAIHNIDIDNTIDSFVGLLREIAGITKTRRQKKYSLADFPMMAFLFKNIPYKKLKNIFYKEFDKIKEGRSNAAPSLTNIGIIEVEKIDFDTNLPVRAYMLGGINHPSLFQIAVSTYRKNLTLSVGSYYCNENEAFVSNFIEELKNTVNTEIMQSTVADLA